jgi:DNA-binding response OmpR family regulator
LKQFLQREGFVVEFAHEGRAGLEMALHGQFDLVVLDVMLPGIGCGRLFSQAFQPA